MVSSVPLMSCWQARLLLLLDTVMLARDAPRPYEPLDPASSSLRLIPLMPCKLLWKDLRLPALKIHWLRPASTSHLQAARAFFVQSTSQTCLKTPLSATLVTLTVK